MMQYSTSYLARCMSLRASLKGFIQTEYLVADLFFRPIRMSIS